MFFNKQSKRSSVQTQDAPSSSFPQQSEFLTANAYLSGPTSHPFLGQVQLHAMRHELRGFETTSDQIKIGLALAAVGTRPITHGLTHYFSAFLPPFFPISNFRSEQGAARAAGGAAGGAASGAPRLVMRTLNFSSRHYAAPPCGVSTRRATSGAESTCASGCGWGN